VPWEAIENYRDRNTSGKLIKRLPYIARQRRFKKNELLSKVEVAVFRNRINRGYDILNMLVYNNIAEVRLLDILLNTRYCVSSDP
jgi:hypothetical protein